MHGGHLQQEERNAKNMTEGRQDEWEKGREYVSSTRYTLRMRRIRRTRAGRSKESCNGKSGQAGTSTRGLRSGATQDVILC